MSFLDTADAYPLGGGFAFLHHGIREALLRQLSDAERQALHRHIAERIAARVDDNRDPDPETVYALARHRLAGGIEDEPASAYQAAYEAGQLAMTEHAPDSAVYFLEHAAAAAELNSDG